MPVSSVNLSCQSQPCCGNATEVTITTKDSNAEPDGVAEQVEESIQNLHMSPWSPPPPLPCADTSQPWPYPSRLSMCIDLFYRSPLQKCPKYHLIWRLVFTVRYVVGLKGYDNVWSSEFRIKNSVFQGLAFSSGISPLRTYSRQHSGSQWKGTLGWIAE